MQALIEIVLVVPLFLGLGFAQGSSATPGSIRRPAALVAAVSAGESSTVPDEMNVSAVTRAPSPPLTRLKAMDCAFSRKVHHHA